MVRCFRQGLALVWAQFLPASTYMYIFCVAPPPRRFLYAEQYILYPIRQCEIVQTFKLIPCCSRRFLQAEQYILNPFRRILFSSTSVSCRQNSTLLTLSDSASTYTVHTYSVLLPAFPVGSIVHCLTLSDSVKEYQYLIAPFLQAEQYIFNPIRPCERVLGSLFFLCSVTYGKRVYKLKTGKNLLFGPIKLRQLQKQSLNLVGFYIEHGWEKITFAIFGT